MRTIGDKKRVAINALEDAQQILARAEAALKYAQAAIDAAVAEQQINIVDSVAASN